LVTVTLVTVLVLSRQIQLTMNWTKFTTSPLFSHAHIWPLWIFHKQ